MRIIRGIMHWNRAYFSKARSNHHSGKSPMKRKLKEVPLSCFYKELPAKHFVAIYADGSGASLFERRKNSIISADYGEEVCEFQHLSEYMQDAGFLWWLPLPDNFEFFYKEEK